MNVFSNPRIRIGFTVVPQKFVKPEGEKRFGCTG